MVKLSECNVGDLFSVKYLDGTDEEKRHLKDMGFAPSAIIRIVSINQENMIVQVFDSRIAINKEISDNINGTIVKINKRKTLSLHKGF